jgi:serine/threonine protein phosphatase 1
VIAYAIGDIHGQYELMQLALAEIETRQPSGALVIFLGDYIDRGPQSKEVIEALMAGPRRECDKWVCLTGNHEDMMLQAHADKSKWMWWVRNGGETALQSFGGELPHNVCDWCAALPIFHETEHHFFVHAGVWPGRDMADQRAEDMLWIRDRFLDYEGDFGKHVVHGHTPNRYAQTFNNRTNLDSGAFFTGRLSIGRFDLSRPGPAQSVFTVEPQP